MPQHILIPAKLKQRFLQHLNIVIKHKIINLYCVVNSRLKIKKEGVGYLLEDHKLNNGSPIHSDMSCCELYQMTVTSICPPNLSVNINTTLPNVIVNHSSTKSA